MVFECSIDIHLNVLCKVSQSDTIANVNISLLRLNLISKLLIICIRDLLPRDNQLCVDLSLPLEWQCGLKACGYGFYLSVLS